jgi:hypothetical protein
VSLALLLDVPEAEKGPALTSLIVALFVSVNSKSKGYWQKWAESQKSLIFN